MTDLVLQDISKSFGDFRAVDGVSLDVPNGTFVCMLGPSGCGKTTLLRVIAGLEEPTRGAVLLDGENITAVPTHKRGLGMVFQSLALFPHLDVGQNIAYPLAIRGVERAKRDARVAELLAMIDLDGYAERPVAKLSGGQRQRIAIARALAMSPKLFLLDEPLSALDAKLREAMQVELRQLQQRLGITTIVVTHDQREAMTMADVVVVMGEGRIRQSASPVEIYRQPEDAFVADFIGSTNLLPIETEQGVVSVLGSPLDGVVIPDTTDALVVSIRPEDIVLGPAANGSIHGRVAFVRDLGATVETFVDVRDTRVVAVSSPRNRPQVAIGDSIGVSFPADSCVVLKR